MSIETKERKNLNVVSELKAQAKVANKVALEVGNELLEVTRKSGKMYQGAFQKMVQGGVTIFGMQQDFALNALEQVADRVKENERLSKLVGASTVVLNRFKKATDNVKDSWTEAADGVKEGVLTAKEAVGEAVAETVEEVKAGADQVGEKVVDVMKVNIQKIDGIGPKVEEVLRSAGFDNFEKIAKASAEELEAVLEAAGTSFKKFDPRPWIEEAKEELNK